MPFFRLLLVLAGFLFLRRVLRRKESSPPPQSPLGGGPANVGHLEEEVSPGSQSPQPIEDADYEELR